MTAVAPKPIATRPYPARETVKGSRMLALIRTTDHKVIGNLYLVTSMVFFMVGGGMAMLMRTELAQPGMQFLSNEQYNQLFTMHGTIMLLLYATPILFGFANAVLPLQIGSPDVAFPRLNAFSYWLFLFGGLTVMLGFLAPGGAAGGTAAARVVPGGRVPFVPGAALLARRGALGTGFSEALPGGEDVDLVWRLHEARWHVRYEPEAEVAHDHRSRLVEVVARRRGAGHGSAVAPVVALRQVPKARVRGLERKLHLPDRPVAVLGDQELGEPGHVDGVQPAQHLAQARGQPRRCRPAEQRFARG